jgi:hypothetical protein
MLFFDGGFTMIGYIKAEVAAEKWNVSPRQVQRMCIEGRIEGAVKFGNTWAIPERAPKPTRTGKLKSGRIPKNHNK